MIFKTIKHNQKGIGLVEVIAAFGITIVVLTSLVSLALYTMRSSLSSKLLLEGTKIANREAELVRAYRDSPTRTWTQFLTALGPAPSGSNCICTTYPNCTNQCSMTTSGGSINSSSSNEIIDGQTVTRQFYVVRDSNDPNNIIRVYITVSWTIGPRAVTTHIYTDLSNWQNK